MQFRAWCSHYSLSTAKERPLIMGILNVTPDSFSDGGLFLEPHKALNQAILLIEAGADLIDVGGESSRPGALPISSQEEIDRVLPVIETIRAETDICLAIDTSKPAVMQAAVSAGAGLINDITALNEPTALDLAAGLNVPVCLMHMQGEPRTMQKQPYYEHGVMESIKIFFQQRIDCALAAGLTKEQLILDPGFGFGKTSVHNLTLMHRLHELKEYGLPILLGVSRKKTIGEITRTQPHQRLIGTTVLQTVAAVQGVSIHRTHDVESTKQTLLMVHALQQIDDIDLKDRVDDTL